MKDVQLNWRTDSYCMSEARRPVSLSALALPDPRTIREKALQANTSTCHHILSCVCAFLHRRPIPNLLVATICRSLVSPSYLCRVQPMAAPTSSSLLHGSRRADNQERIKEQENRTRVSSFTRPEKDRRFSTIWLTRSKVPSSAHLSLSLSIYLSVLCKQTSAFTRLNLFLPLLLNKDCTSKEECTLRSAISCYITNKRKQRESNVRHVRFGSRCQSNYRNTSNNQY
jgi:hypothetical protein